MWRTMRLTSPTQILAYLEKDRLYAAYAIGDLEPGMFEQCEWHGAAAPGDPNRTDGGGPGSASGIDALALHFSGINPPALLLIGNTDALRVILESTTLPDEVCLTCRAEHLPMTRDFYIWKKMIPMWRMVLMSGRFLPVKGDCIRLFPKDSGKLAELYALGGGEAFSSGQMEQGVFYGVLANGRLVAVAGTHLVSPSYGVAALGNIFTHPAYRGRGYGVATTSAVVGELLGFGMRDIVLNVSQDNMVAVRLYERLGFECYCPFLEGPASAKSPSDWGQR